jgi:hypothetical protein
VARFVITSGSVKFISEKEIQKVVYFQTTDLKTTSEWVTIHLYRKKAEKELHQ